MVVLFFSVVVKLWFRSRFPSWWRFGNDARLQRAADLNRASGVISALLIALVLLLVAPEGLAGNVGRRAPWDRKKVIVRDYTSPVWKGVIVQTVADFNAVLPRRAPHLVYQRMPEVSCQAVPVTEYRREIAFCSTMDTSYSGQVMGGGVRLSDPFASGSYLRYRANTACHEMMHVVTGILDNHGAAPDTSCVWGSLNSPGPVDTTYMHKVYKKRIHKKKRHH